MQTTIPASSPTSSAAISGAPYLLIVGDSISAEYGLPRDTGWVKLLVSRLRTERFDYNVVNSSVSGDTTSGGLARLPELLKSTKPKIVIIELGGNDGLRGLPLVISEENLRQMIVASQAAGAKVLLVGMRLPPNYGKSYGEQFAGMYTRLAQHYKTALLPFFFEGFGDKPEAFQPDHIHPNVATQALLVDNLWPVLKPLLTHRS